MSNNRQQQTAGDGHPPQSVEASADTCIVGCKLPHGLHLDLRNRDGSTTRYTLKGANAARIVGGYGFTDGIPTTFMEEWLKRNAKHPAVIQGAIFMHKDKASAEARAREGRDIRTGLEPLDPVAESKKRGIEMDPEAVKNYELAKKQNPVRDRQIVE